MYNPYGAPGQYGRPGEYGVFPGAPAMAPPGMAAPGTAQPLQEQEAQLPGRPGGYPFQPQNMPNINFSAPVIRLGTTGGRPEPSGGRDERDRGGRRQGLGMGPDTGRTDRERPQPIAPPTKEEIIRTIFVGGITEGTGGDEGVERILRTAGNLRRWLRATDAEEKPCKFGFAEYDDPESLSIAMEVLREIEVPVKRQTPGEAKAEEDGEVEKSTLRIIFDENSESYIEQWEDTQGEDHASRKEMLVDQAKEALQAVLADLANPSLHVPKDDISRIDQDGDVSMGDGVNGGADIVTIQLTADDELSEIPAEMRETVAREITAFRDRSNRRDLERLKREEEMERQERERMTNGSRSRLSSPPPSAPIGPAGGANGIPVGPRGAPPSGPKAFGQQIPRDYQKGVTFVNGTDISAASAFEDEDTDASDEELERRRQAGKHAELEKQYLDQERRWLNRERSRTSALEREKQRVEQDAAKAEEARAAMAKRLKAWDDDAETARKTEDYYADHSIWVRNRTVFRSREAALDDADRAAEQREAARYEKTSEHSGAMADDFVKREDEHHVRVKEEPAARAEPARFKLSLGAAAQQKAQARDAEARASKRTVAEVEGLLEDEEEDDSREVRKLIPIQFDKSETVGMSEEERAQAARQLAADIPSDKNGLWDWPVQWEFVDESVVEERLRPFVEKKIVEYLGVQEEMLVDVVVGAIRARRPPGDLVGELEGALEEEAEVLVRKLWRMLIFFSESERRGLST